ncbi:MAG: hypothetical protein F6J93_29840 [Oscillatoria sp. SIO1A7]|nr:hypothetical protein [Oscillatoria sp. SIO1A7]
MGRHWACSHWTLVLELQTDGKRPNPEKAIALFAAIAKIGWYSTTD